MAAFSTARRNHRSSPAAAMLFAPTAVFETALNLLRRLEPLRLEPRSAVLVRGTSSDKDICDCGRASPPLPSLPSRLLAVLSLDILVMETPRPSARAASSVVSERPVLTLRLAFSRSAGVRAPGGGGRLSAFWSTFPGSLMRISPNPKMGSDVPRYGWISTSRLPSAELSEVVCGLSGPYASSKLRTGLPT